MFRSEGRSKEKRKQSENLKCDRLTTDTDSVSMKENFV